MLQFLTCVVGLDGFGLNDDGGVIALDVPALVRDRPRDVATGHAGCGGYRHNACNKDLSHTRLSVMRLIVLLSADAPEVLAHGLGTAGGVFLREESLLVGNDLRQIGAACGDHRCHSGETLTCFQLLGARLSGTLAVDGSVLQSGGFHVIVNRAKFLRDLARDVMNRVFKYYFSHS